MIDDLAIKWLKIIVFSLWWFLLYIILGFEVTVIGLLLFIVVKMGN